MESLLAASVRAGQAYRLVQKEASGPRQIDGHSIEPTFIESDWWHHIEMSHQESLDDGKQDQWYNSSLHLDAILQIVFALIVIEPEMLTKQRNRAANCLWSLVIR